MPIDVKNLKSMDEILEVKQALDARAEELKLAEAQSLKANHPIQNPSWKPVFAEKTSKLRLNTP